MRHASRVIALLVAAAAAMLGAATAGAQPAPAPAPLTATIFFTPGPGVPADGVFFSSMPIPITIQVENPGSDPLATTQGFSSSEFFRRLYFTDPNGGIITNKIEEQSHGETRFFTCLSRARVLLSPGVPIVPVEVLPGTATGSRFFREYQIPDARVLYDLSRPGSYTVNAQIPLLVVALSDPGAIVSDCDQVTGTNVNVASVTGRLPFTIVSNMLAFQVSGAAPLPPAATVTVAPAAGATGWVREPATVTFSAVSPPPGSPPDTPSVPIQRIVVQTTGAQPGTTTISDKQGTLVIGADGETRVTFHAEDIAGNIGTPPPPLTVRVDRLAPTVAITTPASDAVYAPGQTVVAQYTCADGASGVATCAGPVASGAPIDTTSSGPKTFTVSATDVAGNVSAPVTVTYSVQGGDALPPTTTASAAPPANGNGWNNGPVTVTLSAADTAGGSGVKQITYAATGGQTIASTTVLGATASVTLAAEGTTTLSAFATDINGNTETPKTLTVRIDTTRPTIAGLPAAGCTIWPANKRMFQIAAVTAADALSGLAGSPSVTVTSDESTKSGEIVVNGGVV